jgi:hypothetical protein
LMLVSSQSAPPTQGNESQARSRAMHPLWAGF